MSAAFWEICWSLSFWVQFSFVLEGVVRVLIFCIGQLLVVEADMQKRKNESGKNEILTGRSYWPKINATELHFARSFQGYPTWPYLAHSNTRPNYCIWCIWRIWEHNWARQIWPNGVSLNILQNALQSRWSEVNRTSQSKSHFCLIPPL